MADISAVLQRSRLSVHAAEMAVETVNVSTSSSVQEQFTLEVVVTLSTVVRMTCRIRVTAAQ